MVGIKFDQKERSALDESEEERKIGEKKGKTGDSSGFDVGGTRVQADSTNQDAA